MPPPLQWNEFFLKHSSIEYISLNRFETVIHFNGNDEPVGLRELESNNPIREDLERLVRRSR